MKIEFVVIMKMESKKCLFGGRHKVLCSNLSCQYCFDRSFASHPRSAFLKEGDPRQIAKHCNKKFTFQCDKCSHIFLQSPNEISRKRKKWCPFCGGVKLCDNRRCYSCYNNSFASCKLSKYIKNSNPYKLFKYSNKKYKFQCPTCLHFFEISLNHASAGQSCYYCSKTKRKLCRNTSCQHCFANSFASHPKSKYILDANPRFICLHAGNKYMFQCDDKNCNNIFSAAISDISNNMWCSLHKNKHTNQSI